MKTLFSIFLGICIHCCLSIKIYALPINEIYKPSFEYLCENSPAFKAILANSDKAETLAHMSCAETKLFIKTIGKISINQMDFSDEREENALLAILSLADNLEVIKIFNSTLSALNFPENLKKLKKVFVENTPVYSIYFANPNSVEQLVLKKTDLRFSFFISKEFFNLKKLEISGNPYLVLVSFDDNLRNLEHINLSENSIIKFSFPKKLKSLKKFDISSNKLLTYSFPDIREEHGRLSSLESLNFSRNYILGEFKVPETLTSLKNLDLSFTNISGLVIPKEVKNLEVVKANHSSIEYIKLNPYLINLFSLELSNNHKLKAIDIPSGLLNLQNIDISYSPVASFHIPPGGIPHLKILNLINTEVKEIQVTRENESCITRITSNHEIKNFHMSLLSDNNIANDNSCLISVEDDTHIIETNYIENSVEGGYRVELFYKQKTD
ncbi:MAG: hypothetical protein K2X39_07910 [Silvanigrellaceae bacterium]|nr:hypothetical protein [Silvanigrellaceae bacterium]